VRRAGLGLVLGAAAAAGVAAALPAGAGRVTPGRGALPGGAGHPPAAASGTRPPSSPAATTSATTTSTTSTTAPVGPPYAVGRSTVTFVDPSRPTPPRGAVPGHAGRTLVTDLFRPVGATGALPLVVFAHGWNSDPDRYAPLLEAWAAAGDLVAAPVLPDSADTLPGSPVGDYPDQARDLSFVATQLLGGAAGPVDPDRVAAAGHSDGGTDVALLALDPAFADHRFRAYLSLSGQIPSGVPGPWGVATPGTLLVMVGTDDEYGLAAQAPRVYEAASMTKAMVTVTGGDHLGIFVGPTPVAADVRAETVRFLAAALGPGTPGPADLAAALAPPPGAPFVVRTAPG